MFLHTIICSLQEVQNISHFNGEFIRLLRWIWLNALHLWRVWYFSQKDKTYNYICALTNVFTYSIVWYFVFGCYLSPVWWELVDIKRVRRFGVRAHIHRNLSLLSNGYHWLVTKGEFSDVQYVCIECSGINLSYNWYNSMPLVSCLFYGGFEVMAFSSRKKPFSSWQYRTHFTVDNDTVIPVQPASSQGFCPCPGLGWFTHFAPINVPLWEPELVSFLSGMMVVPSHVFYTCLLLSERMNMGPSSICNLRLHLRMSLLSTSLLLVEGHNSFPDVLVDFSFKGTINLVYIHFWR